MPNVPTRGINVVYYRKYLFTLLIPQAINAATVILWITVLIRRTINAVTVIRPETGRKPAGNRPESGRKPAGNRRETGRNPAGIRPESGRIPLKSFS